MSEELKIPRQTLQRLLQQRMDIKASSIGGAGEKEKGRKRHRSGKDEEVETALVKWIAGAREKKATLTGPLIKEKAEELAKKLGKEEFKATEGWLRVQRKVSTDSLSMMISRPG